LSGFCRGSGARGNLGQGGVKLLFDENRSRRMVPLIALYYPGSLQVALLGLEQASDSEIWAYTREHDFIFVSKDSDFVDWSALSGQPPKVILLKTGNRPW
jgi:predicted nuclease of predicted toxin-antitoxin system